MEAEEETIATEAEVKAKEEMACMSKNCQFNQGWFSQ